MSGEENPNLLDARQNIPMASPKSDYFDPPSEDESAHAASEGNGDLEKDYDFGSASSNRESGK